MNNRNKEWYKSELEAAEIYGKRVSMSGAGVDKLDVTGENEFDRFKFDNKYTDKKSFSINRDDFERMIRQAKLSGHEFIARIDLGGKLKLICMEERAFINNFQNENSEGNI